MKETHRDVYGADIFRIANERGGKQVLFRVDFPSVALIRAIKRVSASLSGDVMNDQ